MFTTSQRNTVIRLAAAQALSMTTMNVNIINTALVGVLLAPMAIGASSTPTSAVLMMLTFIVVMESACAAASLMTVFRCDVVNMGRLGNENSEAVVPGAGNHL